MAKKKREKPQRILTPHQISRWEQQRRRQRVIMATVIFVIAVVVAFVGIGWYLGQYRPLHETALKVNDAEFSMDYYIEMLKLEGALRQEPDLSRIADITLQNIQRNELIRQGALGLGISVTDEEVKEEIENSEVPDKEAYRDLIGYQLLLQHLLDGHFGSQVPLNSEQRQVMAMMLESESQALEIRNRLVNGEDFGELAGELSLELYSRNKAGDFGWVPKFVLQDLLPTAIADAIFNHSVGELSQPIYDEETQKGIGYWLVRVLERNEEEDEANIQFMLLGNEDEALNIKKQLKAGANWGDLAVEHSQADGVEENRGDYQISEGMAAVPIDEFVYGSDAEIGVISEPLRDEDVLTRGGYWLIEAVDEDADRRIDNEYRDYLKAKALDEWVAKLLDDEGNEIVNFLDQEKRSWALKQAAKG